MNLRKIQDADVSGKNVLVRVDFNVTCNETGNVIEGHRIKIARETTGYLKKHGARTITFVTHLARPDGRWVDDMSTKKIAGDVGKLLGCPVQHVAYYQGEIVEKVIGGAQPGECFLLENIRFDPGEKTNDDALAQKLAAPFDLYVNEAFAVSHRTHASVAGIAKHLDAHAGLWLQKEIENLEKIKNDPEHPAVAIIGGAKIETKVPLIEEFEKTYDRVLVGGKISVEAEEEGMTFSDKVILPEDYAANKFDIGPKTTAVFCEEIAKAKTIVWNGPMGKFEEKPFDTATRALVDAIAKNKDAFSLIGGGESVQALAESDHWDDISFVSTGGGAMLAYLSGEELPGLKVLED